MTETTTATTHDTINHPSPEDTNGETPQPPAKPSHRSSTKQGDTHPSQKATTPPKKATPRKRPSRAKPTTKRGKPAKAVKEKVKETKGKDNGKAKETKATKEKTTKAKETKEKTSKPSSTKPVEEEKVTLGQLGMRHQLILYTMRRIDREMTYDQLGTETGLSRAVLRRTINAQIGNDSLVSRGLMLVNEYETEDGEFLPYYFQITTAGKKLVS